MIPPAQLLTPEYCERQYNARAAIPEHPQIFQRWNEQSEAVRRRLACHLDVAYGPTDMEKLDIFPAAGNSIGLAVFIHGGYWRSLDKSDFSFLAEPLTLAGLTVAIVNYGLCPQVTLDEIVRQTRAAVAWLWRNAARYGADPQRLFASGHSAGGHLAAMMLATDWPAFEATLPRNLVKGGLSVSGLFDLEPLRHTSMNQDLKLGEDDARRLSPVHLRPAAAAPLYLAVGGLESDEFKRQNRLIEQAWPGTLAAEIIMPGFHHLSVIEQLAVPGSVLFRTAIEMVRVSMAR
ncbi:MAG: alpha/beta hydrolase [Betaproteobacteria bacterium]|nr:alpha/beta hydrolase [Betaproteobacteria bacterium]